MKKAFNTLSSELGIACRSQDPAALREINHFRACFHTSISLFFTLRALATKISICGRVRIAWWASNPNKAWLLERRVFNLKAGGEKRL
jgi:hypothetical protein